MESVVSWRGSLGRANHQGIGEKTRQNTGPDHFLRWHLQEGSIVIPKSVHPERIRKNIDVFDFTLSDEDMELIASLDRNQQRGPVPKEMHRI